MNTYERLTRTGPKRLHVLYKYTLSKFNGYNMNAHTHARTHTLAHARAHTHTPVAYQGNETKKRNHGPHNVLLACTAVHMQNHPFCNFKPAGSVTDRLVPSRPF